MSRPPLVSWFAALVLCVPLLAAPSVARGQRLDLPRDLPAAFEVGVRDPAGRAVTFVLERLDLRAPGAVLRVVGADGFRADMPLPPTRAYRGHLAGEPGRVVVASLRPDGLHAEVLDRGDDGWRVRPLQSGSADVGEHVVVPRRDEPVAAPACGLDADPARWTVAAPGVGGGLGVQPGVDPSQGPGAPGAPTTPAVVGPGASVGHDPRVDGARGDTLPGASGLDPHCGWRCEIAFDVDFEYFQAKGSVDAVAAAVDLMLAEVDAFYARDLGVTFTLTALVVRTAPFYAPTSGGDLLDLFRAEWNSNQASIPRDIAHLMTGKPGSLIEFGGLAWVGALCGSIGYGWSMDGANIVGHEVGHNFGAGHCHDESPCNNMCGACFWIGPTTRQIKFAHMANVGCLEPLGMGLPEVAPYVLPDDLVLRKSAFADAPVQTLDVLANDFDSNCEPVFVDGADAASVRGGSVSVSVGSGPGGRDELVYELPAVPFLGEDSFAYTTRDPHGNVSASEVRVDVRPLDLLGAWTLDDGAGASVADALPDGHAGTFVGAPAWIPGTWNGGLALDGTDDHVQIDGLVGTHDELTVSAWVRPTGLSFPFAGLAMMRGPTSASGLHLGFGTELRYTWNGSSASTNWASGLSLPMGAWSFVALCVRPDAATLWMHDGAGWQSATRVAAHDVETFDGSFDLGQDPLIALRHFAGDLDDVRVFDWALDAAQLDALHDLGGASGGPVPRDGGLLVLPDDGLRWAPGALADGQRVYFGSDHAAVRDASPGAPEDMGLQTATSFEPGPLAGGPWFWRVDQTVGASTVPGDVWQFEVPDVTRYRLDEPGGPLSFSDQGDVLSAFGNPTFGHPGASAATSLAVFVDGSGDSLRGNSPIGPSDELTLTAWIKKDGPNTGWDGLLFWRGGSTVVGLNFGFDQELRYHWGDGQWTWDSGLVPPDDTWVFVALVVEPDQASIHWGDGATLTSATRQTGHAEVPFDTQLELGRDPFGGREFRGWIDDVRVIPRALTLDELAAIQASTAP